ncbi:MAG: aminodeoxychorismate synthase component I [Candidatus Eisenbacteria bacterium]|uniref:aminodeoxychorismate synthase n=1 Tax=Eiseniibacteriota bacterium TaxID=2212470 RepID=A0A538UEI3_UNCEI|nr:MAG: aminodeoxychorismate synthase component I [Candidatus Eisenbacteria bacterium]
MEFYSALPLAEEIEIGDPLAAARSLTWLPHPFLLHSAASSDRARWSFFGADPFAVFAGEHYDDARAMWRALHEQTLASDPGPTLVPFTGGVVGYWAYDFGRRFERLPGLAVDDLGLPDVMLAFYDVVGAFDHETRQCWLFSSGMPLERDIRAGRARDRLAMFVDLLSAGRRSTARLPAVREQLVHPRSTFTPDGYRAAVERVKEHIRAGDIFQANLSQRWSLPVGALDATTLALALTEALDLHSPAPYAAFLGAPDHALASASPERFLELRGRRVETRPIKGTRPRGADAAEDARLREELSESPKDRAENVMIVDVLRNDLGRVCETGSVELDELCALETFPQVFHLTSTITGLLRADRDAFDLLHACFPGGSITGAPKIRAMEIIESLEPKRRHLYTGSIGYIDWDGDADWNIAIRTALVTPEAVHFSAGGGITADSDAEAEYRETLDKAEGLRLALERVLGPIRLAPAMADHA